MDFLKDLDAWGLLLLLGSAGALFGLGKWASGLSQGNQFSLPHEPDIPLPPPPQSSWSTPSLTPSAEETTFAPEPELGPVRITKFYFAKFDLGAGPADPYSFYDELFVELYDSELGHRWTQSYGVATPQGLEQILEDKSWNYLYANGIIVVPKYDVAVIREAVVARIAEDNERFKPEKRIDEESL